MILVFVLFILKHIFGNPRHLNTFENSSAIFSIVFAGHWSFGSVEFLDLPSSPCWLSSQVECGVSEWDNEYVPLRQTSRWKPGNRWKTQWKTQWKAMEKPR